MTDLARSPSSEQNPTMRVEPLLNTPSPHSRVVERLSLLIAVCEQAERSPSPVTIDPLAVLPVITGAATIISELEAERERLNTELDTANNNHRSMAHQLAETGTRLLHAESSIHRVREAEQKNAPLTKPVFSGTEHKESEFQTGKHFLIRKNGYFYRPNAAGYTSHKSEAGRFTLQDAQEHCFKAEGVTAYLEGDWPPELSKAVAETNADAPGNVGLVSGVSTDQTSLTNKTGENDAVKTAESSHSPSTLNAETE